MHQLQSPHPGTRRRHDTSIFERHQLANGVTVWRQRSPLHVSDEGVLLAAFIGVGSYRDPIDRQGLAHFFEHLPFRGTTSYPSSKLLTNAVRSRGGSSNASTGSEITKYYVTMPQGEYQEAVSIVHELVTAPLFRAEDLEIERGVIMNEHDRYYTQGTARLWRDVYAHWYPDHVVGRTAIGTHEGIAAATIDDMRQFGATYYVPTNLHLFVGGTFADRADWLTQLEQTIGAWQRTTTPLTDIPPLPAHRPGLVHELTDAAYGRDTLVLEWVLPPRPTAERAVYTDAVRLCNIAFAGGMDAPLMLELRDRLGLVYESGLVTTSVDTYGTIVTATLPVPRARFDDVRKIFFTTLAAMPDVRYGDVLGRWQLDRQSAFTDPVRATMHAPSDVHTYGTVVSYNDAAAAMDAIDLDLINEYRAHLVQTEPQETRVYAGS